MRPSIPYGPTRSSLITKINHLSLRQLHCYAQCSKNPYYFYDLQRQQGPPASSNPADLRAENSSPNRRVFNPLMNQSSETMEQRVSKVFGAMGSRDESRKEAQQQGITVAGVHVPARPEEPTNCCMSGCINCVWELYKDELEEYRTLRKQAREKLNVKQYDHVGWPRQLGPEPQDRSQRLGKMGNESPSTTNEDDGGDSELSEGIKVFIATEKRLHEKQQRLKPL